MTNEKGKTGMSPHHLAADILLELERAMRMADVWDEELPSPEALASQQPFCIDTLSFTQWLQFVFVERVRMIIEQGAELPAASGIKPMAEEYFAALGTPARHLPIIDALEKFDLLISGEEQS